jgi:hypothetical protein
MWVNKVTEIIMRHNLSSIADLGTGDFYLGDRILRRNRSRLHRYVACDISSVVIEENKKLYNYYDNLTFLKIDIRKQCIPAADLIIMREVLQHLSNKSIRRVFDNLKRTAYKILVVGIHQPIVKIIDNVDIPDGPFTRLDLFYANLNLNKSSDYDFALIGTHKIDDITQFEIWMHRNV